MSSLNRRLRRLMKLPRFWAKRFMVGMLRALMISNRPDRLARSGFVLPTTVLLLLVVTLTAGALTYRSFSRSDQAIALREQKVITNAATPAVDRAKAKIEYAFQRDDRLPGGLPSSDVLAALMIAPGIDLDPDPNVTNFGVISKGEDIYTLPDETRMDLNGDSVLDNAWFFRTDINGDGQADDNEIIAYSILMDDEGKVPGTATVKKVTDAESTDKAKALVTRTGPISTSKLSNQCRTARAPEGGWQIVNSSRDTLQKNFQIDAFVLNRGAGSDVNRTVQTLEFQQSREAARGSKWGAWFRYDLEVFPGPEFKWNGAMHAASNFFVQDNFKGYMVSSNQSCIYSDTASEITLGDETDDASTNNLNEAFQGQFVRGTSKTNTFAQGSATPEFHFYNGSAYPKVGGNGLQLGDNTDSASDKDSIRPRSGQTPTIQDISVNPITLFTEGISKSIADSTWERDPGWSGSSAVSTKRIYNKRERKPYVDDFFRADNRWGPKPETKNYDLRKEYTANNNVVLGAKINPTTHPGLVDGEGLDGYWERQAIATGLRMIVGQRLNLGNAFGWNVNPSTGATAANTDPLYPPNATSGSTGTRPTTAGDNNTQKQYWGGVHEVIQRKSLRDNLAAVQSMAVYHYETNGGTFPLACMAMTAHPGTKQTILDSRTFTNFTSGTVKTNFLEGKGTNGWEFRFPDAFNTESEFATEIASTQPLGIALRNLAYFAGDPSGGAPSFTPVQDGNVHPFPQMSMWGDFSPLRRIFKDYLDATPAVTYANLSPADKSTLHTAACTLGMLAYQLDGELAEYLNSLTDGVSSLQNVGVAISQLIDGTSSGGNPEIEDIITTVPKKNVWFDANPATVIAGVCPAGTDTTGYQAACDTAEYYSQFTSENWITAYAASASPTPTAAEIAAIRNAVNSVRFGNQIIRDRALGFKPGNPPNFGLSGTGNSVDWNPITGLTGQEQVAGADVVVRTTCDPDIFSQLTASGGGGGSNDRAKIGLALMSCTNETVTPIKYPSLYYLFPIFNHDHDGSVDQGTAGADGVWTTALGFDHSQPTTEEYITQSPTNYIATVNPVGATSTSVNYKVVKASGGSNLSGFSAIKLTPGASDLTGWVLPKAGTTGRLTDPDAAAQAFRINLPNGTSSANVAFLDKGMYDGREQLSVRVLDLNLNLLTTTQNGTGDYWISDDETKNGEGIVYAFREDAVREDEIVRPKNATATATACSALAAGVTNPRQFNLENDANCRMTVQPGTTIQDPPLTDLKISLKPVDYYPDPERRPHGFRFRNGADISNAKVRESGMTFVTDNSVYIQGDFNLHSSDGTVDNILEEFTDKLSSKSTWGATDFYADGTTGRLNGELNTSNFANLTVDYWRPVEILADAVGILSGGFQDGNIGDTFVTPSPTSDGGGAYSYQNQNRPYFEGNSTINADNWIQENEWTGSASLTSGNQRNDLLTPVHIDRNGGYALKTPQTSPVFGGVAQFTSFGNSVLRTRNLITAPTTRVNATIVSGLVPARPNQAYGGFHNFPHFNEYWGDNDLYISGSFLQLDFSTASTAPFDQDAWERGERPVGDEFIWYYEPPDRLWGYDVGLQYVPPAPVSRRFITYGSPRSEYYREVPVSDPYMSLLRCGRYQNGGAFVRLFPNETQCPS